MKILELRKKIITNSIAATVSLVVFCGCIFYNMHQKTKLQQEADLVASETSQINTDAEELQSKTQDIKKYMALWANLSDSKKSTTGIKMDEVNNLLNATALKYNISAPIIKVTLPEPLSDGIFNCSKISTLFTTASLSFLALNDSKALLFVNEFANSLPGYVVITDLNLKKEKDYTNNDLIEISLGKGSGKITGNVSFFWYAFKNKVATPQEATAVKQK